MLLQQNRSFFCWFTGSAACARLISKKFLEEKSFMGTNFASWCLIGKSQNFLPCKNFLLYDMKCNDLTVTFSVWPGLLCSPPPQYWGGRPHPPDSPPHLPRSVPLTVHLHAGVKRQHRSVTTLDYTCTEPGLFKVISTILSHYTHWICTVGSHLSKLQISESSLFEPSK